MPKISKHNTGRYYARITLPNGKRKCVYGLNRKEVQEKLLNVQIEIKNGVKLDSKTQKSTFKYWADTWLKYKRNEVKDNTYKKIQYILKHPLERFGHISIKKIKFVDIQELIYDLAEENPNTGLPSSHNILINIYNYINNIMILAMQNQIITYNPCLGVRISSKVQPKKRRALTVEEQTWIINTKHRAQLPAMIMLCRIKKRRSFSTYME